MSSVQHLREFISERLTAAAEEIFIKFEKTIVQYEEKIDRQRRLLDITWKPQRKLTRTGRPQQHVCEEKEADQLPYDQDRNSRLDQAEPDPIKEDEKEACSSQQGLIKQQSDTFMSNLTDQEGDLSEPEANSVQVHSTKSYITESQDQDGSRRNGESDASVSVSCDVCGRAFEDKYSMEQHRRSHTDAKRYTCQTCGKSFSQSCILLDHMGIHTAEKLYSCETCGKSFSHRGNLTIHMRSHTSEKLFYCETCGKSFHNKSYLTVHRRIHTGEKLYSCETCGKKFTHSGHLSVHKRIHTGEKAYSCETCGKSFNQNSSRLTHMKIHTGEKPFSCVICGKGFRQKNNLLSHMRIHTGEVYSCRICGKVFRCSDGFNAHMKSHKEKK